MTGPHQGQPTVTTGETLDSASAAVILIHGRDRDPADIIQMTEVLPREGVTYLAPQAAGYSWYPDQFQAPVESNEPGRSSALEAVDDTLRQANNEGIPTDRTIILGFSQGACIASEYVVENPERYGGVACLSGGIMGETADPDDYSGDIDETPVLLGSAVDDPYMPEQRVHETADVFEALNGDVIKRLYDGDDHTINEDELDVVEEMLSASV